MKLATSLIVGLLLTLQAVAQADYNDFTVNIPNSQGGYTAIVIKQSGSGYTGPQGEYYTSFPTVVQLQVMYASNNNDYAKITPSVNTVELPTTTQIIEPVQISYQEPTVVEHFDNFDNNPVEEPVYVEAPPREHFEDNETVFTFFNYKKKDKHHDDHHGDRHDLNQHTNSTPPQGQHQEHDQVQQNNSTPGEHSHHGDKENS